MDVIVTEWLGETGGAEHVFLAATRLLPHAQIRAMGLSESWHKRLDHRQYSETWLAPAARSAWGRSWSAPLMPLAWRVPRARADHVLVFHHAFASSAIPHQAEAAILYVHTPARYLWMPELDARGRRLAVRLLGPSLRTMDRRAARRADHILCNSEETRKRIQAFWGRDAEVIHPPVRVEYFSARVDSEDVRVPAESFLLGVGRWISYKRFDLAIEIAAAADTLLVLCGSGPEETALRSLAQERRARVCFLQDPPDDLVRALMQQADALLFPGIEDFGIVPVEAQAAGLPVIATRHGGALETVRDGISGALVDQQDVAAWLSAIEQVGRLDRRECVEHAGWFSEEKFSHQLGHVLIQFGFDVDRTHV